MTKHDWIDVLNSTSARDWADWLVIAIAIISPLITLAAVVYAAKTAKASKESVDLNIKMYHEQKEEQEKLYLPLFDVGSYIHEDRGYAVVNIVNRNSHQITGVAFRQLEPLDASVDWTGPDPDSGMIYVTLNQDFKDVNKYSVEVKYNTIIQKRYSTRIDFKEIDSNVTAEILETKKV